MFTLFAITAAVGCTILVFQFVMTLLGFAGDAIDLDVSDLDMDVDVDLDFDADATGDHHHASWILGVISFKTIVAFLAFFGLGGLAADSMELHPALTMIIALAAGIGALFGVYYLFFWIAQLRSDGTPHIGLTVGREATVYTTIPGEMSGTGKIQINVQARTMEYGAQTEGPALEPGTLVVVTTVLASETVQVQEVQ